MRIAPFARSIGMTIAIHVPHAGDRRTQSVLDGLAVERVVRRLRQDPGFGPTACLGIGYREMLRHLDGEQSLEDAVRRAQRATRVLVRRQETWLRSFPDLRFVDASAQHSAQDLARAGYAALHAGVSVDSRRPRA